MVLWYDNAHPAEKLDMIHKAQRHERIVTNPRVMLGKPTVKGTRITVEMILRKLGGGMTPDAILQDHPHLTPDDIRAARAFAADASAEKAAALARP
jgi:uncharacterized protein (DUF433 family)